MNTTWSSPRAFKLHATVMFVVAACLALGWWQLERALGGNTLSWVYTFEWPFFAAYGVYMWWRLIHEEPGTDKRIRGAAATKGMPEEQSTREEEELARYNEYLAELNAIDRSSSD